MCGGCAYETQSQEIRAECSLRATGCRAMVSLVGCVERRTLKNNLATDARGWPWNSNVAISPKNFYQWIDRSVKFQGVQIQPDGPERHAGFLTVGREGCRAYTDFCVCVCALSIFSVVLYFSVNKHTML